MYAVVKKYEPGLLADQHFVGLYVCSKSSSFMYRFVVQLVQLHEASTFGCC